MKRDQDKKALTGEDHGLRCRSTWKCPEILLHASCYLEPCTTYQDSEGIGEG